MVVMDAREVRMRCLELAAARGGWEPNDIIAAAQSLESFVNSAPAAQTTTTTTDGSGALTSTAVATETVPAA
jgi:hypothetical protein